MKAIKICVSTLVILMSFSPFAFCQKQDKAEKQLEELKSALELSDDQMEQIIPILAAQVEQEEKDRELYENGREKLEKTRRTLHKKTDEQIIALLTEKQIEQFKKFREEHRKNKKEHGQRPRRRANK
jgi:septation ring formation regulator EzrA